MNAHEAGREFGARLFGRACQKERTALREYMAESHDGFRGFYWCVQKMREIPNYDFIVPEPEVEFWRGVYEICVQKTVH